LIIGLVSPWWVLTGENGRTQTSTKTLLYPPKIITLSRSSDVIGGDISQVPSEVTMVLSLILIFALLTCFTIFITLFSIHRFRKTTKILAMLSIVLLVFALIVFSFTMSQIAEVGVGSFIGNGEIDTVLPGTAENKILSSTWGPGIGFYLGLLSLILLVILFLFEKKIEDF
jgi:hypothetical protein